MTTIILCGGAGTRLWPLSRTLMPKQFVPLLGQTSLFRRTVERNAPLSGRFVIVTNADQWFLAAADLAAFPSLADPEAASFILEPVGRNTAPAIALACLGLDPEETVLVAASDHLIRDAQAYEERVRAAQALASQGYLVTFGIEPAYPETGYGYIEADASRPLAAPHSFAVKSFREKPAAATAERYLAAGDYLWNSGMFVFKAGAFLAELGKSAPAMLKAASAALESAKRSRDPKTGYAIAAIQPDAMRAIPADSIDYAVMERSGQVAVVRSDFGWSDVGSYDALYDSSAKDADGNAAWAPLVSVDSGDNLFIGERTVAAVGVRNLIVVDSGDALLVARRGASQGVKAVVDALKAGAESQKALTHAHLTVHRPWGSYTVLDEGEGFKVKRIAVSPGSKLSLQKHARRAERWVVVSGSPVITIDAERRAYAPGEVAQIPLGAVHRLENAAAVDAVIIETQIGDYLGEDDIVRLEDVYGRS